MNPSRSQPHVRNRLRRALVVGGLLLSVISVSFSHALLARQYLDTVAGGGPEGLPALQSNISYPTVILPGPGLEYTFGTAGGDLLRVDAAGILRGVGGSSYTCNAPPYGDGLPAKRACFSQIWGLARDANGDLYVSDTAHFAVRRIDARTGLVSRVTGNYISGFTGDGGPAGSARLSRPRGIVLDAAGNLYIADKDNNRVRRISKATGVITTVAGTGVASGSIDDPLGGDPRDDLGDGGPAMSATLNAPFGLALDAAGNLFIGDYGTHRIRRLDAATGIITTVAGDGTQGWRGDGVDATTTGLAGPMQIQVDAAGNILFADSSELTLQPREVDSLNHRVRRVEAATGLIFTVAGSDLRGFFGDGQSADGAALDHPTGVALDASGNVLIADEWNYRVRVVNASNGIIQTAAGNGTGYYSGDGQPARRGSLAAWGLGFDPAGSLLICDGGNSRLRRVDRSTGIIATIAGTGVDAGAGDGGPALAASFQYPVDLDSDASGNIYLLDQNDSRVRRIDAATGIVTRVAGTGYGFGGDGGSALNAMLANPEGIALAPNGDLYIADTYNLRIRRVRNGNITTVAGNGNLTGSIDGPGGDPADDLGDGGPGQQATFIYPSGIKVDGSGDLLIADFGNHRLRKYIPASGQVITVAGTGVGTYGGDGGPAAAAPLYHPYDVDTDSAGNIFIADWHNNRIRRIDASSGIITTVAGDGTASFGPDGSPALSAGVLRPIRIGIDASDQIFFTSEDTVRTLVASPLASGVVPDGAGGSAPLELTRLPAGDLFLWWGSTCTRSDNDFIVYAGTIGSWGSHVPVLCSTGGATGVSLTPGAGSQYFFVVPRNPLREGSLGTRSDGSARPEGPSTCLPRSTGGICS